MPSRNRNNRRRARRAPRRRGLGSVPLTISNGQNRFEKVRFSGFLSFSSSALGVVAAFIPTNLNTSGLNNVEYTSLAQLWDQVKIDSMRVELTPVYNAAAVGGQNVPLVSMSSSIVSKAAPGSHALVLDDGDGQFRDASYGAPHEMRWIGRVFPRDIQPCSVGDEIVNDNQGMPGGFSIYATNLLNSTPNAVQVHYVVYIWKRNRI